MGDAGGEAEGQSAAEEDEEVDPDTLPFNSVAYWKHFYAADEEMDFYEWYSADEWLPQATERVGALQARARVVCMRSSRTLT